MSLEDKVVVAIDDTASIRTFLRVSLEDEGATVYEASTASEGLTLCEVKRPDFVVLDLGLPDRDGLDLLPDIKVLSADHKATKVIILTVRKGQDVVNDALAKGASAYLNKPFMVEDLLEIIDELNRSTAQATK